MTETTFLMCLFLLLWISYSCFFVCLKNIVIIFLLIYKRTLYIKEIYPMSVSNTVSKSESGSRLAVSDSLWPHGILQARVLERVAFPFSRGSFPLRNWTRVYCIVGGFFTNWAIRETTVRRVSLICFFFFFHWRFGTCLLTGESTILFPWGALLWLLMRVSWRSWISAPSTPWLPSASRQSGPQGR